MRLKPAACVGILLVALIGCRSTAPAPVALAAPAAAEVPSDIQPASYYAAEKKAAIERGLIPPPPPAVATAHWSLASVEQLAMQSNPTLAAAAARIDVAKGKQHQAGLYPNPVIGYHATQIGNLGTAGEQGAFVRQRIITGGKLKLDQAVAARQVDQAGFGLNAQQLRVLSDVRVRFFESLVAQRRVALTKELVDLAENFVKASRKLLDARQGTENDLLQAELRADEARILFDNADNEHKESWRRLPAVIGTPDLASQTLEGDLEEDFPVRSWEECYHLALHSHPELGAAQARLERARIVIERAKREPIPDVDVLVSARHNNVTGSNVANIQLGIPIPIFDNNRGNIRAAEAEWIRANNDVKRIEAGLQDRLAVVFRRYSNARQQVDRYRKRMIPKAKRSLNLVTTGYEKGQVNYLTLLTAQQAYVQVNLSYLDSIRELRAALAIIEGQLLTDSLQAR